MPLLSPRRLEASNFAWDELTDRQRTAVERVASLMLDAVDAVDNVHQMNRRNSPRHQRRSQLAFVDGDRGTGKTSVWLTIREFSLSPEKRKQDAPPLPKPVQSLIENRQRFQWLETLDMEPIRRDVNLFAAVLARLERASGTRAGTRSLVASAVEDLDLYDRLLADLSELQNDAVLAWNGSNPKRAESLELDAYAAEVLRAESAGLQINERMTGVLEGLAKLYASPRDQNDAGPIFILPVDDFDLAPTRCLELLRLIRTVTTPRLFFLICGNVRLAQTALVLQNESELARLIPGVTEQNYEWEELIRPTGVEVAANNLRKLLPPEQRTYLAEISLAEALALKLGDEDDATLHSSLKNLTFDVNANPTSAQTMSMESFLLLDQRWPRKSYSATAYLGGTPRQVHDLGLLLDQFAGHQSEYGKRFLKSLSEAVARDVREEWRLPVAQHEPLAVGATLSWDEKIHLRDLLDASPKFSFPLSRTEMPFDEASSSVGFRPTWISQGSFAGFEITMRSVQEKLELPPHLTGGVTLLHDVAMSLWGGYLRPDFGSLIPAPAQTEVSKSESMKFTWIATSGPLAHGILHLPWPTPYWTTFRQVECFNATWESLSRERSPDELGVAWIESVLRTTCDEPPASPPKRPSWNSVAKLLKALVSEKPTRFMRKELRWTTLEAIVLLCAPEYQVIKAEELDWLADQCKALEKECQTADVATGVREKRAKIWNCVTRNEGLRENEFRVFAAIAPKLAEAKLKQFRERFEGRGDLPFEVLQTIVAENPHKKHRLNETWKLTPTAADVGEFGLEDEAEL